MESSGQPCASVLTLGCAVPATLVLEEPTGPRDQSGSRSGNGTVYTQTEPFNADPESPVRNGYLLEPLDGAQVPHFESISLVAVIKPRGWAVEDLTGEAFRQREGQSGEWVRLPSGIIVGPKAAKQ